MKRFNSKLKIYTLHQPKYEFKFKYRNIDSFQLNSFNKKKFFRKKFFFIKKSKKNSRVQKKKVFNSLKKEFFLIKEQLKYKLSCKEFQQTVIKKEDQKKDFFFYKNYTTIKLFHLL